MHEGGPEGGGEADARVVRAVLAGDREAFGALIARYRAEFGRLATALTGDPDDGADALQEAFVRAFESLAQCRNPAGFRSWFYRILSNACVDARRRTPKGRMRIDAVTPLASSRRADATVEQAELAAALHAALARLTPEQREAFVLREVDGRSYAEMAELAGVGVDALKMRVYRARDVLRGLLEEYHE